MKEKSCCSFILVLFMILFMIIRRRDSLSFKFVTVIHNENVNKLRNITSSIKTTWTDANRARVAKKGHKNVGWFDLEYWKATLAASQLFFMPEIHGNGELCLNLCKTVMCSNDTGNYGDEGFVQCAEGNSQENKVLALPDYFTIGYSQAGSTYFSGLLTRYSSNNIIKACRKEVHFFDKKLFELGLKATGPFIARDQHAMGSGGPYLTCFASKIGRKGVIIGDNTIKTIYTDPGFPLWVRAINPKIKLIVLLRDPVRRTFSRYALKGGGAGCTKRLKSKSACENDFDGYVTKSIEYLTTNCNEGFKDMNPLTLYKCSSSISSKKIDTDTLMSSLYVLHIKHWLKFFPREQFLFVSSEELFAFPKVVLDKVDRFLSEGIEKVMVMNSSSSINMALLNSTQENDIDQDDDDDEIEDSANEVVSTSSFNNVNRNSHAGNRKMKVETERKLRNFFQPFNTELEKLIGQSLKFF